MCSMSGLPTPGSEVSVLIKRVNLKSSHGLVELWVDLDNGRKQIHEQKREEILIPQKKFHGSEGKPGDLCLVCVSDTWHRARIMSIQSGTCNVLLIDQGQLQVTTSAALAWGRSDGFLRPPEIESCILANVISAQNEWPETVTKFLMCLPGKKFKGLVQHVVMPDRIILLEIPIVSKHMCKLGAAKKIKVDDFKELVQKRLHSEGAESTGSFCLTPEPKLDVCCQVNQHDQFFYPELTTDIYETVKVMAVIDPLNISCMLFIFSKAVKLLSDQIHQHYEENTGFGETQPQNCGDLCAAKGTDGRWRRSLLNQSTVTGEGAVEVSYVDEGRTELVKAEDIKPLLRKFQKMPVVTYHCSLSGVKANGEWAVDKIHDLKSMLLNQTLLAKIDDHNKSQDVYCVTLYGAKSECINTVFLEKADLVSRSESEDLNVQRKSSSSSEEKKLMDLHFNNNAALGLQEKTWPNSKLQVSNGLTGCSKVPDPLPNSNGPLTTGLEQNACNDSLFAVGKTVDVNITFIEIQQKFWCRATESRDSLRCLMQNLQNYYESAHPQPVVESICVARNPDNKMWYRAKIIAYHDSPTVGVRYIDYGQTQEVPLQDVRPIDPAFLQLGAQAVQCCLFNPKNSSTPITWTGAALAEFKKLVDLAASSQSGLKCVVKAITSDEDGVQLHMVDIQTESESLCKLLAQICAQSESQEQSPPEVLLDGFTFTTYGVEVGGKEEVFVTFSETVGSFYCQLHRNSHMYDKLTENVAKLLDLPYRSDHTLGLNSVCLARYTDGQWYRGQIVEVSPKLKVHFVDYGETLAVLETGIYPFPPEGNAARSVPVQAIPLALFDMPADLPQEVNQWFADLVVDRKFTILVVAKEEKGRLIVELFDGSLNINTMVREKVKEIKQTKMTCTALLTDQQLSNSPQVDLPQGEQVTILDERRPTSDLVENIETGNQSSKSNLASRPPTNSCQGGNGMIYSYKWPNVTQNTTVEVYASCIVAPDYFWCQYANTEDLDLVSKLAEEAKREQEVISAEMLEPGHPCLTLFSCDNQWYRAQVIQREEKTLQVLFIDYGNESEVDTNNVRVLPRSLLEIPPQAFLCRLNGFNESIGSWDDDVFNEFYNLLVDKPLKVTLVDLENDSKIAVPQYSVTTECDEVVINTLMQKYWKSFPVEHSVNNVPQAETSPQSTQSGHHITNSNGSRKNTSASKYKEPEISKSKTGMVYASCIAEPNFFWCQFSDTEDLHKVSQLAQEAGRAEQDTMFPQNFDPGTPCLALFSQDDQWYRAQVIRKDEETLHVVFVDYGNEAEVDLKNVRPLPRSLLEMAPQAFLCSSGFDESKGSWDDDGYDNFYRLLVDKPLKVTVLHMEENSETAIPQYVVEMECEGVVVNTLMEKYWRPLETDGTAVKSGKQLTKMENRLIQ